MNSTLKPRLMGGGATVAASMFHQAGGPSLMARGPMIPRAADGDEGGGTVDQAAHQALVDAHERLKKDAKADRDRLKEMETKIGELTDAQEQAAAEAAAKAGDIEQVRIQLTTKHAGEIKKVTDRAEKAEAQVRKLVIDNGLDAALDGVNVAPALKRAAKALLRDQVELSDQDGDPVALMGGVALADAVKTWAGTDEGKHFVANGNSGGGARGGGGTGDANPWKQGAGFSLTEQDRIAKQDPALAGRLKAEAGVA